MGVTPGVTPIIKKYSTCEMEVAEHFFTEILTLQAGFFDLEAGFYTNKKSNPVGTCQKLTIQAG